MEQVLSCLWNLFYLRLCRGQCLFLLALGYAASIRLWRVLSRFSLTVTVSQRTLYLTLGLMVIQSAAASILTVKGFHIRQLEYVLRIYLEEYQTYFLQLPFIDCFYPYWQVWTNHILKSNLFVSYFSRDSVESWPRQFCDLKILKKEVCLTVQSTVYLFLIYKHIMLGVL